MSTAKITPLPTSLSTSIKHLACNLNLQRRALRFRTLLNGASTLTRLRRPGPGKTRRGLIVAMSSSAPKVEPLEICVKASTTTPNKLGDYEVVYIVNFDARPMKRGDPGAPGLPLSDMFSKVPLQFTQRVLLMLEEKHLPYDLKLVDLANKPEWFLKISPEGKVPVIKLDDKWMPDSDVITQALEEKFPEPPLATPPEKASIGAKIFSTFIGFLRSKDPKDGTEQALLYELTAFNDYLKENGPLINGNKTSAADLSLGPKLYHLEIALGHYMNWSIPDSLPYVKSYMKTIFSMESFVKTRALAEDVIEGWRLKVVG